MAIDQKDALARLKESRAQSAASSSNSKMFYIKDNEKALIHCLRNHNEMVPLQTHRLWDEHIRRFTLHSVCAKEYGQECQHCNDVVSNPKLRARDMFYLPVFVFAKIDEDGQKRELNSVLYLEMTDSDGILIGLESHFYDNDARNITECDYTISRTRIKGKVGYTVNSRQGKPQALPADLVVPNEAQIRSDVELAHPMETVDSFDAGTPPDAFTDTTFIPDF